MYEDDHLFSFNDLLDQPDDLVSVPNVWFTKEGYGPVTVIAWRERVYAEPIFLVTNLTLPDAACLAYLWIIYLGLTAIREDWVRLIHRADRCDWSLFHLGLALLDYFLNEELPIPVSFTLLETKSVR